MHQHAIEFMERFDEMWRSPTAQGFADLFDPDGRFKHPSMSGPRPASEAANYMRTLLASLPDLSLEVRNWAAAADTVLIEYTLSATVGGRVVSWGEADRFNLRHGRAIDAVAYFDPRAIGSAPATPATRQPATTRASLTIR